jgi:GTP-binding protein
VFEISAINRQGTADLVYAIHRYIQRKKELAAKLLAADEVDAVAVVSTTDRNVLKPE